MNPTDPATTLLHQYIAQAPADSLWWVDENILLIPEQRPGIRAITNRYDLYQQLKARQWQVTFNDFDSGQILPASLSCVLLRLPKEKALVHYLINQTARLLRPGGELWLIGDKSEGVRGFNKRAAERLGGPLSEHKVSAGLWFARISHDPQQAGNDLDDQHYTETRPVTDRHGYSFISKPGLYGWQKVDPGSAFLIAELPTMLNQPFPLSGRVLDLGCGFGYLSLQTAGTQTQLTCTDNNAAALHCCQANLEAQGILAEVVASNAGDTLQGPYDILLCNPPFHSGFATNLDLTSRFIAASARLLSPQGQACFVVNKHIPLEQKAQRYFARIRLYADNGQFKLIHLSQPKHSQDAS
ncbi:Ribosomal RNA small subunit methyltransferase C [Nitrincola lacisaponensis]|uniref:Ribosomal RNA small subunit methyltransferase C n=1 Tax=Nitrincola lacisaponensis TaxID=267850 RepID=A0A063Y2F4_9GAMM|nr:methyltransferase [Nitrincola lacisaponensis]KDE38717.1 Ribosomal RNA small subunit methyltransferase C [Nitrincola lacisaponensis]